MIVAVWKIIVYTADQWNWVRQGSGKEQTATDRKGRCNRSVQGARSVWWRGRTLGEVEALKGKVNISKRMNSVPRLHSLTCENVLGFGSMFGWLCSPQTKALRYSEISVNLYEATRHHNQNTKLFKAASLRTSNPAYGNKLEAAATGYWLDGQEIRLKVQAQETDLFLCSTVLCPALISTQLPNQWILWTFPDVKRLGHETEHSCPYVRYVHVTRSSIFIRDKPIFSSERMLHKNYYRKVSVEKKFCSWVSRCLTPRRSDWL
jgi:hypothetical protein